jgi:hypothetical protein
MNIQLVMAHPDDEIIFGWPALVEHMVSSILICSNDINNPERTWCRHRCVALDEIGALLDIPVHSLPFNSEFYRMPTRDKTLQRMMETVLDAIDPAADAIFTHNPWGEYGHLDHITVHLAAMATGKPVFFTDIFTQSNWMHMPNRPMMPGKLMWPVINDLDFYDQCRQIYANHGVWTWNQPPVTVCNIYSTITGHQIKKI